MILSEKELEDYICNNQKEFIKELKGVYGKDKDIKFIGRQVRIGENNIADLVYYYDTDKSDRVPFKTRNYIIVELKYRKLTAKDLAQISRYMSLLREKIYSEEKMFQEYESFVYGLFVSFGQDDLMQEIMINFDTNTIDFLTINSNISFEKECWSHSENYIKNIELDKRINNLYRGKNE